MLLAKDRTLTVDNISATITLHNSATFVLREVSN